MADGAPRLDSGTSEGDAGEDLFRLGALLSALATGMEAEVSWRLDGPPSAGMSMLSRRAVLGSLAAPRRTDRVASAAAAASAFEAALTATPSGPASWPLFRGDPGRTGGRPGAAAASLQPVWDATSGARSWPRPSSPGDVVVAATVTDARVAGPRRVAVSPRDAACRGLERLPTGRRQRTSHRTDDGELVAVDASRGGNATG